MSINPWNNKCCANCSKVVAISEENGGIHVKATSDCPHSEGLPFCRYGKYDALSLRVREASGMIELSSLFDFVCDSWTAREPTNLSSNKQET